MTLKYLRWPYREYIKTAKNDVFCAELLSENDFDAILAIFCCYDYGANASEAVQYHRVSQMLLDCYNLLNSQNIPINQ